MAIDFNKIAASAIESYLHEHEQPAANGDARAGDERRHRFGGAGAVAVGVGLAIAARAAYTRVRGLDLEQLAGAVEDKLKS
jgi:hypothetical protein